jgi:hypothetical protein
MSAVAKAHATAPGYEAMPSVVSRGAGTIGNRSGQQVNLRFLIDSSYFYESGQLPLGVDSKGALLRFFKK